VRVYNLNDLSLKPIEINEIKNKILGVGLTETGNVFVACANNTVLEYNILCTSLQNMVYSQIRRNLTTEEWVKYIGKDVPYRKINPNFE
jgi:CTP:phosphocholine cytidylyltransferase-like protein